MGRIINIEGEKITIGNSDGSISQVEKSSCNFEPKIGDEVEVFSNDTKVIVTKITTQTSDVNVSSSPVNNITVTLPNVVMGRSRVNKVAYCVLALFGGGIGLHKLCAGQIGKFLLFLIFCWTFIPWAVSIFNFFGALFETADENGDIYV